MRKDAQRSKELILAAAREVYAEQGVEAPLDVIARRAGVGNATLYRRFPDRAALIEAVFQAGLRATVERGERARGEANAWAALTGYLEYIFAGLAEDRGANDLMTTALEGIPSLEALHAHHHATVSLLLARSQDDGVLRPDVTTEDLLFALGALGRAVPAAAVAAPDSWRRPLALLLDGLRAPAAAEPLPAPPLTRAEFGAVLRQLAGS